MSASALAQVAPNPTQHSATSPEDAVLLYHVTLVAHTTPAVNYRPRHDDTPLDFEGTSLLPKAEGHAKISGEKGYIQIDSKFSDLEPATRFGPEYLTYVMWAITPEGRATNLGELQVKGDDGRLKVTTELQAFALIVTAEPYFAVTQPSDVVVLENVVRKGLWDNTNGRVEPLQAKYELLKRGTYLMTTDGASVKWPTPDPGVPLDLAQARNAVEIARLARADQYAADTYAKAARLVAEAEEARRRHKDRNKIMMPARQAAQTAEDARISRCSGRSRSIRSSNARRRCNARTKLGSARAQRKSGVCRPSSSGWSPSSSAWRPSGSANKPTCSGSRPSSSGSWRNQRAEQEKAAAEAARAAAERERLDAERQRADADRVRAEAERARLDADAARAAAEAQAQQARAAAEAEAQQARSAAEQAEREKAQLREQLRAQLNAILETRETARGLVVNVSDVLFDFDSANLKPGAREKVMRIAAILRAHSDLKIEVDGHTDNVGTDAYNQRLSERRAESVRSGLVQQGISREVVGTAGFGESRPVATNGTASGRQQNRRVEIVVSGESIGVQQ
jgi:outer membrane protein OmpA-like peptidoglycan-associated protein